MVQALYQKQIAGHSTAELVAQYHEDTAFKRVDQAFFDELAGFENVNVTSPYDDQAFGQISPDRTVAFAEVERFIDTPVKRYSSGMRVRLAFAVAAHLEPEILLFDEPTSALDPELIGEVITLMEQLAHEGSTMIVVSHEMGFAHEAADRVLYLEGGLVVEEGPPEQVLGDPREEATKQFLKRFLSEGAKAPTETEPSPR